VRTLLVQIGGEPYALPLVSVVRALSVEPAAISAVEGRQHVVVDGRSVGLVAAHDVLEIDAEPATPGLVPIVVIADSTHAYGLIVDRFMGEQELVVQSLDATFGKIRDVAAGALMHDGSPILILDADDLVLSIDKMIHGGRVTSAPRQRPDRAPARRKRVLVVDDSLTVRELERKLLAGRGYDVEVAVDGMDGWNAVRSGAFQLVVTDIDMPRMDGIELVAMMNKDQNLRSVPVMVVSYKDREEDRRRGLDAGAARYLTKGSFHDETLVQAVVDLIGEPDA
jgi:two-component system sensor histidine kinase and response regulator WspE